MNRAVNRAIVLCENWQDKIMMLEDTFGKGIEDKLARQQYEFLTAGIDRISKAATPDEKIVLALLKKTVIKLEKQLYPNVLIRSLNRAKRFLYDRTLQEAQEKKLKVDNVAALTEQLGKLGIKSDQLDLDRHLDFEQKNVAVELLSPYGRVNYKVTIDFEKDPSGRYQLSAYTGMLKDRENLEQTRSFTFGAEMGIDAKEAANLLEGRAVLKYMDFDGFKIPDRWIQLDLKKLGPGDQPVMKEMSHLAFDLSEEMVKVSMLMNRRDLHSLPVIRDLEKGCQTMLKQPNGQTVYIEINPFSKEVIIRNEQQKVVSLDELNKLKQAALQTTIEQVKSPEKKLRFAKRKDQSQGIA